MFWKFNNWRERISSRQGSTTVLALMVSLFLTLLVTSTMMLTMADISAIRDHVRKTVGPLATPEKTYFVAKLPKTRSGKIMRRVLKAIVAGNEVGDLSTIEDKSSVELAKQAVAEG